MPSTFTYTFDTPTYKGTSTFNTGLFIGGQWVDPVEPATIDVLNPATGEVVAAIAAGSSKDVDLAVDAAEKAFKTSWGLKTPGHARGHLLFKLAELLEKHTDELAALEALNSGKIFAIAKARDIATCIAIVRYYAGWADKYHGKTVEVHELKLAYTRNEPYGVVGQIIPWNVPLTAACVKVCPALATGNTIVLKPSEITPLTALRFADLINEAGFPPGSVNIVNGYGATVGQAISEHSRIHKLSFTGSGLIGRRILKASAETNLKDVSLELGGKSPSIIFDDADFEQAIKWTTNGIFYNMGQICVAGSRIYVQEGIYDQFVEQFTAVAANLHNATGDPFDPNTQHGPQISKTQLDRVMGYIDSGKADGAKLHYGGGSNSDRGYFIQPTVFTDVRPDMKIAREEIFGPVAAIFKFKTEEEVIELANDTVFGLSSSVFSENIKRALRVAHAIEAGTIWVNSALGASVGVPFGGYKQSGTGREMGDDALKMYTQTKGIHVNLGTRI